MSCCMMSPHRLACRPQLRRPLTSASFHGVLVLSSHHMTIPSQSGLSYFVINTCHPQRLSYPSVTLQVSNAAFSFLFSSVTISLSLSLSRPPLYTPAPV